MDITINEINGIKSISLAGRFDAAATAGFKDTVKGLLQEGSAHYVVDLKEVDYIDSGGLGSLVSLLRQTRSLDGDVRVSGLSGKVRSVFELTRLHRIFEIFADSLQAVKSYQAG
jgi:anti-sigma B factor antagonist